MTEQAGFTAQDQGESGRGLWKAMDVAAYLRVHPKDVYELVAFRGLPCIRIGRRLRFDPSDVSKWVSARKEG